jgi:serine/threonine protein phosphatase PrpC
MDLGTGMVCLDLRAARNVKTSPIMESLLDTGTCSHRGRVRENNEDSLLAVPEMNLFILSDGMGGLASGEVASRLTVDTILAHCREADSDPSLPFVGKPSEGISNTSKRLVSGIGLANRIVYRAAQEKETQAMGATVVAVRCMNERMSVAHVGDSRAYRLRNNCLERLTRDHSFAAEQVRLRRLTEYEASTSNLQNVLTRAVGIEPEVQADTSEELLITGDTILLCSDGLTRELSDNQIACILRDAKDAQGAANQLVNLANEVGGGDNITVIVIRQAPRTRKRSQKADTQAGG